MNFASILKMMSEQDSEFFEKTSQRRSLLKDFGKKIALTAVPFALGSLFTKAYGQNGRGSARSTDSILEVLNFALTLEYLERDFYKQALDNNAGMPFIPAAQLAGIQSIYQHEAAHVSFLVAAIQGAGGTPVSGLTFDFTAGGAFPGATSSYNMFLAVAQTFEDTGVRAYKGRAGELMGDNAVLTAALNIHSVEARHASHIRMVRKNNTGDPLVAGNPKPWITGNASNVGTTAVQASYNGEEITQQAGVNIAGFVSGDAASESFDEPLTKDQVLAIVDPFIN
ncbi:MAG: ferritin-like domain-containing protein [Flavipsychrobacter sp.]|nr:ferritin-like domain-containing protein [Flavipsychrobacter sp.]